MIKRAMSITPIAVLSGLLMTPALIHAQMPSEQPSAAKDNASAPNDPHNLNGMWEFFANIPGQGIYATPSKTPSSARRIPCLTIMLRTSCGPAPRAMRMPIS